MPTLTLFSAIALIALGGFIAGYALAVQKFKQQAGQAEQQANDPLPLAADESADYVKHLGRPRLVIATGRNEDDPVVVLYRGRGVFPPMPVPYAANDPHDPAPISEKPSA